MAAVSNPLQGCIKRCTETYRECDRGESNLDSHHERNETDEVWRPCWFAHSLKTDSRSVENNQTKETPAAVGEKFFLALLLKGLFVHVRIYDWLFSCLYIQYILYSKYKVKIYNIRTSIQKIKSRKIKIKKMSEMDINKEIQALKKDVKELQNDIISNRDDIYDIKESSNELGAAIFVVGGLLSIALFVLYVLVICK